MAGFNGEPGHQMRFVNASNLFQALRIALTVQEVERKEKSNNSFYTKFENSAKPQSRCPNQCYSENDRARYSVVWRAISKYTNKVSKSKTSCDYTKYALSCYECEGLDHIAREYPTRIKGEGRNFHLRRVKSKGERSRHSHSPSDKHAFSNRRVSRKEIANSGNDEQA